MPIPLCTCDFSRAPHFLPQLLLVGVMTLVLIFRKSFEISCLFIIGRIIIHHCLEAMRKTNENQSTRVNSSHSHLKNARVSLGSPRFCSCLYRCTASSNALKGQVRCPGTSFVSLHQVPSVYRVLLSCSYQSF